MYFFVAHIHCFNKLTEEAEVIRVTNRNDYVSPSEHTYWPHLKNVLNFEESLFSRGSTSGEASVGVGEIVIENSDAEFDAYRKYAFDGRNVEVYRLESPTDATSDANMFFRGVAVYAQLSTKMLAIYVKNRLEMLTTNIQAETFAGTNNGGPEGTEGNEGDLKGKTKPMVWGTCLNVPLMPINKSMLIYGCNYDSAGDRKAVAKFFNVADKGGAMRYAGDTPEVGVAGIAGALWDEPVAPGFYKTCLAEGAIKLGGIPVGDVTADVAEVLGEDSSAPRTVRRILEEVYGEADVTGYDDVSLEALHELNKTACGYYVDEEVEGLEVINDLLSSIGGWMVPDRLGILRFGRFDLPTGLDVPVATYDENLILDDSFNRLPTGDEGHGIPAKSYTLFHSKLWKVLGKTDTIVSIGDVLRDYYAEEFRSVRVKDTGVEEAHPLAPDLSEESLMVMIPSLKVVPFLEDDVGTYPSNWDAMTYPENTFVQPNNRVRYYPVPGVGIPTHLIYNLGMASTTGYHSQDSQIEEVWNGVFTLSFDFAASPGFLTTPEGDVRIGYGTASEFNMKDEAGVALPASFTPVAGLNTLNFMYDADDPDYSWSLHIGGRHWPALGEDGAWVEFGNISITPKSLGLTPQQEAQRRLDIHSSDLARYSFDVPMMEGLFTELGQIILLRYTGRFDLDDGMKVVVIGKNVEADENRVTFDVIGAE